MNDKSSRSHSLILIKIQQKNIKTENVKNSFEFIAGKIYFIDLAGSEKQKDTKATGK